MKNHGTLAGTLGVCGLAVASLAGETAAIRVGDELCGFRVKAVTELPDVPGRLWRMEYARNGADLVWLDQADENKVFAIAFKTIPEDDSGVAHIMEHSVLNGSEKFPVKEPFAELLKSSLATFINAWTSSDCTAYPVATRNGRDYLNLAEVYLDAVFCPLSLKNDWSMRQEGWHYEFDGTNLTRNGIVYSEMQGVFGNPTSVACREVARCLFPDNAYGKVSGGDPQHIPELTYSRYRAFHDRFYHPSNARIFLNGRIDLPATLALLDSYLRRYDRKPVESAVPRQRPVSRTKTVRYACAEDGDRTILMDGWVFGAFDDRERRLGMEVLCDLLAGSNEAPLKKALLEAGLCQDFSIWCDGCEQLATYARVMNTSPDKAAACRRLLRVTVDRLCREGLDARRLAAILNRKEFQYRERDSSQRGLSFMNSALESWLYGGDPAAGLRDAQTYAALRKRIGTGWYEQLLRTALLENPHHAEVTMVPSKTFAEEQRQARLDELARIRAGLSDADLTRIAAEAKALRERQSRPDAPADLAKLPQLRLKDIPLRGVVPDYEVGEAGAVPVLRSESRADGIAYLDFCFSLDGLSDGELLDVPFLAHVLGDLDTANRKALDLRNELDDKLGGFWLSPGSYVRGPWLVVHVSVLEARLEEALNLVGEVLLRTKYDDVRALERLRTQRLEGLVRHAQSNGGSFARLRAKRPFSACNRVDELFEGVEQLRHMKKPVPDGLSRLAARIFVRDRLTLCLAGRLDDAFVRRLTDVWPRGGSERRSQSVPAAVERADEGFVANGTVAFMTVASRLPDNVPYTGAHAVAAKIVSLEHLWDEIRVKGGAYGGNLVVNPRGDVLWSSWRDPKPARSLGEFRRSGEILSAYVKAGRSFEKYQVSTVKETEPNLSPRETAAVAYQLHFNGRTPESLQRRRREILATTAADLLSFAETLSALTNETSTCVFASERLLKSCGTGRIARP